jgi:hypothetical protein
VAEALVVPRQADVDCRRLQAKLDLGRRQFDVVLNVNPIDSSINAVRD